MKTFKELMDEMIEALKRKVVYRDGKRQVKKVTDKKGFKVVAGKEVRMDSKEKMARKKAAIKSARKRKSKGALIAKKRAKTMKKRGDR